MKKFIGWSLIYFFMLSIGVASAAATLQMLGMMSAEKTRYPGIIIRMIMENSPENAWIYFIAYAISGMALLNLFKRKVLQ